MEVNAQKIRAAMIDAKLNVRALAKKSGVSEPALNLILNHGKRADTVGKIAAALGVSGMELLKEV